MPPLDDLAAVEAWLSARLAGPLPGHEGQAALAPRPRTGWQPGHVPDDSRPGAALVLLYPCKGRPHVLLTLRDSNLPHHAGQVSLPGGAAEPGEGLESAALREAHEETGVDPGCVRVIGRLSALHIPVSGFALHPFVGVCDTRPDFQAEAGEVARILEPALAELVDPACLEVERRTWNGRDFEVPVLRVEGERVWGATAMILAEFLELLGCRPDPWGRNV